MATSKYEEVTTWTVFRAKTDRQMGYTDVDHVKEAWIEISEKRDFGIFSAGEIKEAGEYLYGPRFASQLGRALGVTPRAVRRWGDGTREPSARISKEIAVLIRTRRGQRVHYEIVRFADFVAKNRSAKLQALMLIPFIAE